MVLTTPGHSVWLGNLSLSLCWVLPSFHSLQWLSEHHGLHFHPQTSSPVISSSLNFTEKEKPQALIFHKEIYKLTHHVHAFLLSSPIPPAWDWPHLCSAFHLLPPTISGTSIVNHSPSHLYLPSLLLAFSPSARKYTLPTPIALKLSAHTSFAQIKLLEGAVYTCYLHFLTPTLPVSVIWHPVPLLHWNLSPTTSSWWNPIVVSQIFSYISLSKASSLLATATILKHSLILASEMLCPALAFLLLLWLLLSLCIGLFNPYPSHKFWECSGLTPRPPFLPYDFSLHNRPRFQWADGSQINNF